MSMIEIRGLDEIIHRMQQFPNKLITSLKLTMNAALLTTQEHVPPYPPPPESSTYIRTGLLGKSLGVSADGDVVGHANIYEVHDLGGGNIEGRFGTNLKYAPYVISDTEQATVHQGRWWTLRVVAEKSRDKVISLFSAMGEQLAAWLDRNAG